MSAAGLLAGLTPGLAASLGVAAPAAAWTEAAVARLATSLGSVGAAGGTWAEAVIVRLLWASLAGALAVALVALAVRLAPRLPASLRSALWWLACLKLVLALVWVRPLAVPLPSALSSRLPLPSTLARLAGLSSPPPFSPAVPQRARARLDRPSDPRRASLLDRNAATGRAAAHPAPPSSARSFPWLPAGSLALLALWAAGLAAGFRDSLRQLAAARRILRGARPAGSPALAARFAELAAEAGLARPPALLVSAEVATPVAVARGAGLGAPAVVLPAGFVPAGREPGIETGLEMDMALCHELAHVRRGDLRLGWVPALAARLFFFHPLACLAAREYALAREAACDAEVLDRLAAPPAAYARLLLDIGAVAAGRLSGAAALGAAPSPGTLKRRLLMLDAATRRPRPAWLALAGLAALAALVPFHLTAPAEAAPSAAAASAAPAPAAAPVVVAGAKPSPSAAHVVVAVPVRTTARAIAAPAQSAAHVVVTVPGRTTARAIAAPAPSAAPVVVAVPVQTAVPVVAVASPPAPGAGPVVLAMAAPAERATVMHRRQGEESYILLSKEGDVEMSGSTSDLERARKLAAGNPLFWFRRGGHEYVVRDPALLARVDALFAPQRELGRKQGELGGRQGELGGRQGALGAKQGELGSRLAGIALRGESAERERDDISRQMDDLGRQQEELGRQQEELGRKQEALGREQERASREAEAKLKPLLDDAIARGLAQEVR